MKEHLAYGATLLQPSVCIRRFLEGQVGIDMNLELAGGRPLKDVPGPPYQVLSGGGVMGQGGTGQKQGAPPVEDLGVEDRGRAASLAAEHYISPGRQAADALLKSGLANAVVHHLNTSALGEPIPDLRGGPGHGG